MERLAGAQMVVIRPCVCLPLVAIVASSISCWRDVIRHEGSGTRESLTIRGEIFTPSSSLDEALRYTAPKKYIEWFDDNNILILTESGLHRVNVVSQATTRYVTYGPDTAIVDFCINHHDGRVATSIAIGCDDMALFRSQ